MILAFIFLLVGIVLFGVGRVLEVYASYSIVSFLGQVFGTISFLLMLLFFLVSAGVKSENKELYTKYLVQYETFDLIQSNLETVSIRLRAETYEASLNSNEDIAFARKFKGTVVQDLFHDYKFYENVYLFDLSKLN